MSKLSERHEYLLGSWLLGAASAEELSELEIERKKTAALDQAMQLLDKTGSLYSQTAPGEESNPDPSALPAYTEPRCLAEKLGRLNRVSPLMWGVLIFHLPLLAWMVSTAYKDAGLYSWQMAGPVFLALCLYGVYPVAVLYSRYKTQQIAEGGKEWSKLVNRLSTTSTRKVVAIGVSASLGALVLVGIFAYLQLDDDMLLPVLAGGLLGVVAVAFSLFRAWRTMKSE